MVAQTFSLCSQEFRVLVRSVDIVHNPRIIDIGKTLSELGRQIVERARPCDHPRPQITEPRAAMPPSIVTTVPVM